MEEQDSGLKAQHGVQKLMAVNPVSYCLNGRFAKHCFNHDRKASKISMKQNKNTMDLLLPESVTAVPCF